MFKGGLKARYFPIIIFEGEDRSAVVLIRRRLGGFTEGRDALTILLMNTVGQPLPPRANIGWTSNPPQGNIETVGEIFILTDAHTVAGSSVRIEAEKNGNVFFDQTTTLDSISIGMHALGDTILVKGTRIVGGIESNPSRIEIIISGPPPTTTPTEFSLHQNYPNPFNPNTTIAYELSEVAKVRLVIYNLLGQKVYTLVDEQKPAGSYTAVWDGKNETGITQASGVYIYRLVAVSGENKFTETKRMLLLK